MLSALRGTSLPLPLSGGLAPTVCGYFAFIENRSVLLIGSYAASREAFSTFESAQPEVSRLLYDIQYYPLITDHSHFLSAYTGTLQVKNQNGNLIGLVYDDAHGPCVHFVTLQPSVPHSLSQDRSQSRF